ncbi:glycosyltransferase family 1 protein [Georgenia sp. EYE_87]|uniref:glycosyltransferase family 4 protein n=1 Tax=Georgenia sp. EYE_87 TaxID=2853448 RepID=UPI00200559BE|nr:glycosyltransferase family 1 protein [Georgenia sp. EYE_87]MCK6209462.1 glycosyltransferase family 1 protein [Georgenia sp. EYE_87]
MRVAIVTESFLPAANGVTTSVLRVLDHLAARGHDAVVVCPGPAPRRYAGFPVVQASSFSYRGFRAAVPSLQLVRTLDAFAPDVLHAASPFGLGAQALVLARRRGVPTVAIFQTDVAGFARKHGLSATAPGIWRWLRHVHSYADLTLAPSSASLADLAAAGVERTAWWGRGVDAETYHPRHRTTPEGAALRRRLLAGAPEGTVLAGYVGRLAPEKRVERLAVLNADPGVRLVVVGDGPSRPTLERQLPGAAFLGRLDGTELARAYAALDVFVHTGTHETFGQTLQEAMASGVTVVAPAAGGPLDVVAEGDTGYLYAPEDDRALAGAVRVLAADPAMRARMGEAGRRRVLPRSWAALGEALLGHYATVIDRAEARVARQVAGFERNQLFERHQYN